MCVNGASWVQEHIVKKYADEDFAVYAVWFNMIPGDRKDGWDSELLEDDRVTHFWDEKRVLGKWVTKNLRDCPHLGPIDWDSFYLFDGDAKWGDTLEGIQACGTPIYSAKEKLETAAKRLFADTPSED